MARNHERIIEFCEKEKYRLESAVQVSVPNSRLRFILLAKLMVIDEILEIDKRGV